VAFGLFRLGCSSLVLGGGYLRVRGRVCVVAFLPSLPDCSASEVTEMMWQDQNNQDPKSTDMILLFTEKIKIFLCPFLQIN
jgi:hypothetical protein